jgi:hypothetical protein
MSYTLVENDTGVQLEVTCTENDPPTPIDLTDCTVLIRWQNINGTFERQMTILDIAGGVVTYTFGAAEIVAPDMEFELQITNLAGNVRTSLQTIRERVRERLG